MSRPGPELSVIVPVYNEAESVGALAAEIAAALVAEPSWECVWVDDGSTDGTRARLLEVAAADGRHRVLALERNSGQSAALLAGFARAGGALFATLDGDGQNPPSELPRLLARLREGGADMVNGRRARRIDSWVRRISSKIANGARNAITGRTVSDVGCALRVFRRDCAAQLPPFRGMHRFLPTLVARAGWTLDEVDVAHRERGAGVSKYGIGNRLWVGIADLFGVLWLKSRFAGWRADWVDPPPRTADKSLENGSGM